MRFPDQLTSSFPTAVCDALAAAMGGEVASCVTPGSVIVLQDGKAPEWVHLLPMGVFAARDGRKPWLIKDKAHAASVVAASKAYAGATDMVFDYDHQSEAAMKDQSVQAPASGWIKDLQVRDDGIWGRVEWTARASAHLEAKEYRYVSPVFAHEKHDAAGSPARVLGLLRAALTNNPALTELAAVASTLPTPKEPGMNPLLKKLLAAIGLPETTTEDQAIAACSTAVKATADLKTVAVAAGLPETSDAVAICAAVKSAGDAEPDATKYVPIQMFKDLQTQVASLQTTTLDDKAATAVETAIASGKIPPAQKDFWLKNAKGDLDGFNAHVATLSALPGFTGGEQRERRPADPATITLTAQETAACAQFGWDPEAFLADKKAELAR